MSNSSRAVVDKMFSAFGAGDVDKILETVTDDTVWIYHGTQVLPKGHYEGKDGARTFFNNIQNGTEIIHFEPEQYIVDGNMVVVLGNEHQKVKSTGKQLKQKWVQIYTIKDNLISRMEEFATSEVVE